VNQSQADHEQKSIIRTKRLLSNARCISAASYDWSTVLQINHSYDRGDDPRIRPSERTRFEHAFYRVWMIGVMGTTPHLQDRASRLLNKCSPRELCRLDELATWAKDYNNNEFQSVGLNLKDEVWKTGLNLVSKRWSAYRKTGARCTFPDDTPVNFFAFYDHTQRYVEMHRDD
jgi:hypothetical protein